MEYAEQLIDECEGLAENDLPEIQLRTKRNLSRVVKGEVKRK